jgi:5'-methylthioadenosine phosphorylase
MSHRPQAEIGVLGGSGLYDLAGFENATEVRLETPFGPPSDAILVGTLAGRPAAFLARHGRSHTILPSEINYAANIYAMKMLGVSRILSASAVGSMREDIHPREVVLPDQFLDRTQGRRSTFFGDGVVAHVSLARPVCRILRKQLEGAARSEGASVHDGGTYLCIQGPAFSTRAESMTYRSWNVDVIGMTNAQEAKLAREAEICYATLALVTDYDCWHEEEEDVSVEALLENLRANSELAARILRSTVRALPGDRDGCCCGEALKYAIITPRDSFPAGTRERLGAILGPYLD